MHFSYPKLFHRYIVTFAIAMTSLRMRATKKENVAILWVKFFMEGETCAATYSDCTQLYLRLGSHSQLTVHSHECARNLSSIFILVICEILVCVVVVVFIFVDEWKEIIYIYQTLIIHKAAAKISYAASDYENWNTLAQSFKRKSKRIQHLSLLRPPLPANREKRTAAHKQGHLSEFIHMAIYSRWLCLSAARRSRCVFI